MKIPLNFNLKDAKIRFVLLMKLSVKHNSVYFSYIIDGAGHLWNRKKAI